MKIKNFFQLLNNSKAQYMVEFALSISVFFLFIFLVINMSLFAFNLNLLYSAMNDVIRSATLGYTDTELKNMLEEQIRTKFFPTPFVQYAVDGFKFTPADIEKRVDGEQMKVELNLKIGLSLLVFGEVVINIPRRLVSYTVGYNDLDRDGVMDRYDSFPNDHDGDSIGDSDDDDDDNDGIIDDIDVMLLRYSGGQYDIITSNASSIWVSNVSGEYRCSELFDGLSDATGGIALSEASSVAIKMPMLFFTRTMAPINNDTLILDTSLDRDNDGWEDKFDNYPDDKTKH